MSKVLFLSPPRRFDGTNYLFNNASLILASYLARRGVEAWVEPLCGKAWPERLARALDRFQPDVVAISCKWWDTLYGAVEVCRRVREHRPQCKIVCGGQTANSFAEELVLKAGFDAVIRGDGELPLYEFAKGEPTCNLTFKAGERAVTLPHKYVQPSGGTEDLTLFPDLTQIADPALLIHAGMTAPYVWTGKGCQSACLYCAGSAFGHKKNFGRTGYLYRPLEQTLQDMETLAPWTRDSFMYDFDPITDPGRLDYYHQMCQRIPRNRYHGAFYCWSLPTVEFIDMVAETFASALISVDAQTYSEPLRKSLADRNRIKPFSSDAEIMAVLDRIRKHNNIHGVCYGIVGLAGEKAEDVERAAAFSQHLQTAYGDVVQAGGVNFTPLTIEPDSLMDRNPEKYGLVKLRSTFEDYLEFTGSCFERSGGGVFAAPYEPGKPHPFGIHQECDDPGRVYGDYHRLRNAVIGISNKIAEEYAMRSLRIEPEVVSLRLHNRSMFQDDWRLVLWAIDEALAKGIPEVHIDATTTFQRVPPMEVLEFDERFEWIAPRVEPLRAALAEQRLAVKIAAREGQHWGFLEQLGARVNSGALPLG